MIYGLGVLSKAELLYDPKVVRLTIFQPRLCHCSTWEITPAELKKWGEEVLRPTGAMGRRVRRRELVPVLQGAEPVPRQG